MPVSVTEGLRSFAVAFAAASGAEGNLVFSPFSIAAAFAMVSAGAAEGTYADIAGVFGFPPEPDLHPEMAKLVAAVDAANNDSVTLDVANAVWTQSGLPVGPSFLATLADTYGADLRGADFEADPDGARHEINAWVAAATRDRIPQLLAPGTIDRDTLVALVNAVYMHARWRLPFDAELTEDRPFTLPGGSIVEVPTMHRPVLGTVAVVSEEVTAVQLPYVGDELAMVVILDGEDLSIGEIVDRLAPMRVALTLPKWDIATTLDLAAPLSALGLPIPGGDYSRIVPGAIVSAAAHAANITVDETSTEAAAATAVMVGRSSYDPSAPVPITINRPFRFLVHHTPTSTPLFYGQITTPHE